ARMKHFDHAISYLDKALQLLESPNADRLKVLVNLGGVYLDQGSEQEAKNTFTEALALAQMLDAAPISAVIHTNLSNLYINLEDWSLAESHAERSLHIRDSLGASPAAITLNNLGYAQVKLKKT